jgi:hypothetical protein
MGLANATATESPAGSKRESMSKKDIASLPGGAEAFAKINTGTSNFDSQANIDSAERATSAKRTPRRRRQPKHGIEHWTLAAKNARAPIADDHIDELSERRGDSCAGCYRPGTESGEITKALQRPERDPQKSDETSPTKF